MEGLIPQTGVPKAKELTIYSTDPGNPDERALCMEIMHSIKILGGRRIRVMPTRKCAFA